MPDAESSSPEVLHNAARPRYEINLDGRLAGFADYRADGDTIVFPHTEIEPAMRNQGLGAEWSVAPSTTYAPAAAGSSRSAGT